MAFNGSGTYSLPAGNPVVTGTTISSSTTNTTNSDIATALTNCLTRDGQSTPSANLPMNAKKLTGLAAGTTAGDSVRYEQVVLTSALGTNVATFLATPSSANLAAALTDETGSGAAVFATSPTLNTPVLVTPALGTPSSGDLSSCTNAVGYGLKSATTTVSVSAATAPTSGQTLVATSSTTATWQNPSAGAIVYLSATTASGVSSIDIETGISSTYDDYIILCDNLTVGTNGTYLYIQNKVGGAYQTSSYKYQLEYTDTAAATQNNEVASGGITSGVKIAYYMTNSANSYFNVAINLRGVNTSNYQVVTSQVNGYSGSDRGRGNASYGLSEAASGTLTGIKVLISSGTLTGVFKLYGIVKS